MDAGRRVPRAATRDTVALHQRRPEIIADTVGPFPAVARVIQACFPAVAIRRVASSEASRSDLATPGRHPVSPLPLPPRGVGLLAPMDPL